MAQISSNGPGRDNRHKFYCDLCNKGYATMADLNNHENDYDHQHRKREKDRKQISKDLNYEAKAKAAEKRANQQAGLKTISVAPVKTNTDGAPAKKPVFKVVGQAQAQSVQAQAVQPVAEPAESLLTGPALDPDDPSTWTEENDPSGMYRNGWWEDAYDPSEITGCDESCPTCGGQQGPIRL